MGKLKDLLRADPSTLTSGQVLAREYLKEMSVDELNEAEEVMTISDRMAAEALPALVMNLKLFETLNIPGDEWAVRILRWGIGLGVRYAQEKKMQDALKLIDF